MIQDISSKRKTKTKKQNKTIVWIDKTKNLCLWGSVVHLKEMQGCFIFHLSFKQWCF